MIYFICQIFYLSNRVDRNNWNNGTIIAANPDSSAIRELFVSIYFENHT